jgi:hypothetical protein
VLSTYVRQTEGEGRLAIPPSGTFHYVATVTDPLGEGRASWPVLLAETIQTTGNVLCDSRLVGLAPTLEIADAGTTPNPGFTDGVWRPQVTRSRLTLRASKRSGSSVSAASFYLETRLVSRLMPHDCLYMCRTGNGGLAVSMVRNGRLLAAAGAVTRIHLGDNILARVPGDLLAQSDAVFHTRDPAFQLPELPIEFVVGGENRIFFRGSRTLGAYHVRMWHGYYLGLPGKSESVAIVDTQSWPDTAATDSAALLDTDDIELNK